MFLQKKEKNLKVTWNTTEFQENASALGNGFMAYC